MKILKLSIILICISIFVFACNPSGSNESNSSTADSTNANGGTENSISENTGNSNAADAETNELAQGAKLYQQNCAKCHKEDGSGGEVVIEGKTLDAHNLISDHMKEESDEEYIEYMVKGIPDEGMPAFKDILSEAEMKEIVRYIRQDLQQ